MSLLLMEGSSKEHANNQIPSCSRTDASKINKEHLSVEQRHIKDKIVHKYGKTHHSTL